MNLNYRNTSLIVLFVFGLLLASSMVLFYGGTWAKTPRGTSSKSVVTVKQLRLDDNTTPVLLACEGPVVTSEREVGGYSCTVTNNSAKTINALSISESIVSEKNGAETSATTYLTMETVLHPDFKAAHMHQSIPSGGEKTLTSNESTKFEDTSVKRRELQFDYVEFDDGTTLGPSTAGARIVKSMREGASKYKYWLFTQLRTNKDGINTIVPMLQPDATIPNEVGLSDMHMRQGAKIYRSHLLQLLQDGGEQALISILSNDP
jgi:hypothetical protein